jgi:hypothetical protein
MTQRFKRLSHTIYECKYHVVFCPKYRYRIFNLPFVQSNFEISNYLGLAPHKSQNGSGVRLFAPLAGGTENHACKVERCLCFKSDFDPEVGQGIHFLLFLLHEWSVFVL